MWSHLLWRSLLCDEQPLGWISAGRTPWPGAAFCSCCWPGLHAVGGVVAVLLEWRCRGRCSSCSVLTVVRSLQKAALNCSWVGWVKQSGSALILAISEPSFLNPMLLKCSTCLTSALLEEGQITIIWSQHASSCICFKKKMMFRNGWAHSKRKMSCWYNEI